MAWSSASGEMGGTTFRRPALGIEIIAIGSSTGGPIALVQLFKSLSGRINTPIVLTQHIPKNFTSDLANSLSDALGSKVMAAEEGMVLQRGHCYLAPGGRHLLIQKRGAEAVCVLDNGEVENFCKPSADPMLRSVALAYRSRALAVILTGMGKDGLEGCKAIKASGGTILAQDEATSAVWGMPRAVAEAGLCKNVVPIERMGDAILRVIQEA